MALADYTFAAFTFFNALRVVSYVPQIMSVIADKNGATAISYTTWLMWTFANLSTLAYAQINLADDWLAVVSLINTAGCLAVIILTAWKRNCHRRDQHHALPPGSEGEHHSPGSLIPAGGNA